MEHLNQMLVKMDGFTSSERVMVLAAANPLDVLDLALIRPGRFDRHVNVPRPDIKERLVILDVQVKGRRLALGLQAAHVRFNEQGNF